MGFASYFLYTDLLIYFGEKKFLLVMVLALMGSSMEMLQKVGVAAVPCFSADELFNDPHLQNRGFIKEVEHPVEGKWLAFGPPWRLSASPVKIERYGNDLGQHNDCVFGKLLGMAPEEIVRLKEEKVIY